MFWTNKLIERKIMSTKLARNSTTIKGAVINAVILVLMLLRAFGINVDLDEGIITEVVVSIAGLYSILMIVVGRCRAQTRLSGI